MFKKLSSISSLGLLMVILVAALLRLWNLGVVPPSPDWDEAALGYNAFSILHTLRDEYGEFLPLVLRSFDDYKPGLYTYFIIPFIPLFDLTLLTVRLPAALFGISAVAATYFLIKELLSKENNSQFSNKTIGLLSALILAVSPWHLQFSRIAFESGVGVAFNIFAALAFVKGLKNPLLLIVSTFLMAANLYVYQSEKVFTPLLAGVLIITYWKELLGIPKKFIIAAVLVGFIVALPMATFTLTNKEGLARARGVSVFSDSTQFLKRNAERIVRDKENNDLLGLVLDNRRVQYGLAVVAGYISHFDINWLFITSDLPRHHAPYMGLLYLWELPFVLIGIYTIIFGKFSKKTKYVILGWYLIAAVPASITSGVPHAIRTLNFLPIYPVFTALGVLAAFSFFRGISLQYMRYAIYIFIGGFILLNFSYYLNQYFVQQNYYTSQEWQYGYKEAVSYISQIESRYEKIIVSNKPHLDQSYMFFLFYLKYPPEKYQQESVNASGGFKENHAFGKYEFRPIEWSTETKGSTILYVGRPEDFPDSANVLKTIYFLDGKPAIKIVEG